jgi:hypothetical protein
MIMVSASLVVIALLYLSIGDDVLYSDHVGKEKQLEYKQMLEKAAQEEAAEAEGKNLSVDLNEEMKVQNSP